MNKRRMNWICAAVVMLLFSAMAFAQEQNNQDRQDRRQDNRQSEQSRAGRQDQGQRSQNERNSRSSRASEARRQPAPRQERRTAQEQRNQENQQRQEWQQHRLSQNEMPRNWGQHGGYHGENIPDAYFRSHFGYAHRFHVYSLPFQVVGGVPRFQYDGYWFTLEDPVPAYWGPDWYQSDDVFIVNAYGGYYLDNARFPNRPGVAISVTF